MSRRSSSLLPTIWWTLYHPRCWQRWLRRLFLLTLPVAILCWATLALSLVGIGLVRALWSPLHRFWNAPRTRSYSYGPYEHHRRLIHQARTAREGGRRGHQAAATETLIAVE